MKEFNTFDDRMIWWYNNERMMKEFNRFNDIIMKEFNTFDDIIMI